MEKQELHTHFWLENYMERNQLDDQNVVGSSAGQRRDVPLWQKGD